MGHATDTLARPRALRADAARNRARVLQVAAEEFAEHGLSAGVPEIAARAGVGVATVYRSFPTKRHLVAALVVRRFASLEQAADDALRDTDAWEALSGLVWRAAAAQVVDRAFSEALARTSELPEVDAARARVIALAGQLLARAQEAGAVRADVTVDDLPLLLTGLSGVLRSPPQRELWERYVALCLDGLRVGAAGALPSRPLPRRRLEELAAGVAAPA